MTTCNNAIKQFTCGSLVIEIYEDSESAGEAAARATADELQKLDHLDKIAVIFATGASQLATLRALTAIDDLPWRKVQAFHMDEYVGIAADHPASFRRYLRENLTQKVAIGEIHEIDGTAPNPDQVCADYASLLRSTHPRLCLLGIGENGHLAFNDPSEAEFDDPMDMKIVRLDVRCRRQQTAEGWFKSFGEVPESALTLTIPTLLRVPKLIASVPGARKAAIVRRTLEEPISTDCPATILRTHPNATLYLDLESAAELDKGD